MNCTYGVKNKLNLISLNKIIDNIVRFAKYNISKKINGYFDLLGILKTYRDKKIGESF